MSFFFVDKPAPRRAAAAPSAPRGAVPVAELSRMGCRACPRNAWERDLARPKMRTAGQARNPVVLVLTAEVSRNADARGDHLGDRYGKAVLRGLEAFGDAVATGTIVQCADRDVDALTRHGRSVDAVASACCRPRVEEDVARARPWAIVGVGDAVLRWATGLDGKSAAQFRGRHMPVRIGGHACWFYCVAWPDFAASGGNRRTSEYERAFWHDMDALADAYKTGAWGDASPDPGPYDRGIHLITGTNGNDDLARLQRALRAMAGKPEVGIDIETTCLRPWAPGASVLTTAIGEPGDAVAFPLNHPDGWATARQRRDAWGMLGEFLLYSGTKVAHNLAFEQEWLGHEFGWDLLRRTEWDDSMAMAHTLDERIGLKSLEVQTVLELGFNVKAQSRVDVSRPEWWKAYPIEETLRYNALDMWCVPLARRLRAKLRREPGQWRQYERKLRTVPTLVLTQAMGLHVDDGRARELRDQFRIEVDRLHDAVRATPEVVAYERDRRRQLNPGSDDDVLSLMRYLDRPEVTQKQRDGSTRTSTDKDALAAMPPDEVPSAQLILDLRVVSKLVGTYLQPIIDGKYAGYDGLIHTAYSQMVAETSRLAAEDPNVQNFPKRKHREVRGVIRTPYGWLFVAIDFGQMEFRVIGMASEDDNLVRACWTDYDVHGFWAQRMVDLHPRIKDWIVATFGVDWDEKGLKTLRQEVKNGWTFPQFFGSALDSIATTLHLPERVADRLDREFWDEFRGVRRWQSRLIKSYERDLYVETLDGHRRRGPLTKNQIINLPIQGTAARINIDAMNALSERAQLLGDWDLHPVLNVHDDITTRMPEATHRAKLMDVVTEMCRVRHPWVNVPLLVEVSTGARWDELAEVAKYRSDKLFGHPNPYEKENAR